MEAIQRNSEAAFQGLSDKIALIREYYRDSLGYPSVRAIAEQFAVDSFNSPNIEALFARLRSHFRYVPDPVGVELIKAPWIQASEIGQRGYTMGDCDDAASLSYSILQSLGIPARLAVGWYGGPNPSHIWVVVPTTGGEYFPFDLCARTIGVTKDGATRVETYA